MCAFVGTQKSRDGYRNVYGKIHRKNPRANFVGSILRFNVRENFVAQRKANFYPKKTKCSPNRAMKHIGAPIEVKGQIKVAPSNDAPEGFHRPASEIFHASANNCGNKK